MPAQDGAADGTPLGVNAPSWVATVTRTGDVPSLPKVTFTVLDWPSVSAAVMLRVATVRCPACSVQSCRVSLPALTVTAAVAGVYLSPAAVNVWLPVRLENSQ